MKSSLQSLLSAPSVSSRCSGLTSSSSSPTPNTTLATSSSPTASKTFATYTLATDYVKQTKKRASRVLQQDEDQVLPDHIKHDKDWIREVFPYLSHRKVSISPRERELEMKIIKGNYVLLHEAATSFDKIGGDEYFSLLYHPETQSIKAVPFVEGLTDVPNSFEVRKYKFYKFRGLQYTVYEDIALLRAYIHCSGDPIRGVEQKEGVFQSKIRYMFYTFTLREELQSNTKAAALLHDDYIYEYRTKGSLWSRLLALKKLLDDAEIIYKEEMLNLSSGQNESGERGSKRENSIQVEEDLDDALSMQISDATNVAYENMLSVQAKVMRRYQDLKKRNDIELKDEHYAFIPSWIRQKAECGLEIRSTVPTALSSLTSFEHFIQRPKGVKRAKKDQYAETVNVQDSIHSGNAEAFTENSKSNKANKARATEMLEMAVIDMLMQTSRSVSSETQDTWEREKMAFLNARVHKRGTPRSASP